ncbi:MAG: porin [Bacteroidales bacterium]|nr:porin [Bacteroidales bacterium]
MEKKHTKTFFLAALLSIISSHTLMGQTDETAENWQEELSSRITLNGYAQGGFEWQDMDGNSTNSFVLKRVLVWAKARITDRWSFLVMHNFSGSLLEYYTDLRLTSDQAISFRIGQFKNSYSLENPLSPSSVELIEVCSQPVSWLAGSTDPLFGPSTGRDLGMMFYGQLFNGFFNYELAVMNGQGINRKDLNSQKDLIAKIDLRPVEGLRIVATGQKGTGHAVGVAAWNPGIALDDDYIRDRYSFGAEYKIGAMAPGKYKEARPFSLRSEVLGGQDGDVNSLGGYVTACLPLRDGWDIIACADYLDRNTDVNGWKQANATLGVQYWFYQKCRVQLQYTRCIRGSQLGEDYNWLQTQFQIAF